MSRGFKILLVILLLIPAWLGFAWFLAERLIVEKPLEHADVILVLGGSSVYVERAQKAAELYKKGIAPKIILSDDGERGGWSRIEQRNTPYVELTKKQLIAQGVAPENIEIFKANGSGTIYEALEFQKIAAEKSLHSVLIVTSAYHTRRALWTFEKVLTDEKTEIGINPAPTGEQTPPPFIWWLSYFGWNVVAGEYVKSAYYWVYY
ncbi:MAG: YdcF family protein [Pyrinomonadaceae bacterium]